MALTQVSSGGIADGAVTANDLENSGVTAGTYGSSSAIPAITVDAKGRVTSATTSAIDSTSISNGTSNVSVANGGNVSFVVAGNTNAQVDGTGLLLQDNKKIRMGGSADLEIFHDGTNSFIRDVGTGNLVIRGTNLLLEDADGNDYVVCTDNGAGGTVEIKHNNSTKLATSSTGIDVTGTVTCDGLTSDGDVLVLSDTGILTVRDSDDSGNATTNFIQGQNLNGANRWRIGQVSTGNEALYVTNYADQNIIFATNGTNRVHIQNDGHLRPNLNNTYDLGTSSLRWRNVYTNDLNLSNEGSVNDVDGTWGSWTIQEGEDDLFLLNRRNGKKYKFALTEVN